MWIEATTRVDGAAIIAIHDGEVGARLIPTGFVATGRIEKANLRTACRLRAARAAVWEIATAGCAIAGGVDVWIRRERTLRECHLYAGEVPFDFAAERIEVADRVAAARIVAARVLVDGAATRILERDVFAAQAARDIAVVGRELSAEVVPTRGAAEWVDVADGFAANRVVAVRGRLRIAATSTARVAATTAEALSPVHARLVPRDFAATRIDGTNGFAALCVAAVWIFMHHQAGARCVVAAVIGQLDRELDAAFIPTLVAAILESDC